MQLIPPESLRFIQQEGAIIPSPKTTKRSRSKSKTVYYPPIYSGKTGGSIFAPKTYQTIKGKQYTVSESHNKGQDGHYHEGGPFFTYRSDIDFPIRLCTLEPGGNPPYFRYSGALTIPIHLIPESNTAFTADEDSSYLDPIGAEAISLCEPTNPNAETGVAIAEILREKRLSIPGIEAWKRRAEGIPKMAAGETLNAFFGWLPLVGAIEDTMQSIRDVGTILENYRNASGTVVSREFNFPWDESEEETVVGNSRAYYNPSGNVPYFNSTAVPVTRHRKTVVKRRFSGEFTYKANDEHDAFQKLLGYSSDADKLFGTTLTPDVLWELTPWSWAIDWFSNASNVIHNIGVFELAGLVMRYGYIMEETSIVDTYSMPSTGLKDLKGPVLGTVPPVTITKTVKRRREANPFGFGLSWDGLSPTQLAITAALGITRLR